MRHLIGAWIEPPTSRTVSSINWVTQDHFHDDSTHIKTFTQLPQLLGVSAFLWVGQFTKLLKKPWLKRCFNLGWPAIIITGKRKLENIQWQPSACGSLPSKQNRVGFFACKKKKVFHFHQIIEYPDVSIAIIPFRVRKGPRSRSWCLSALHIERICHTLNAEQVGRRKEHLAGRLMHFDIRLLCRIVLRESLSSRVTGIIAVIIQLLWAAKLISQLSWTENGLYEGICH